MCGCAHRDWMKLYQLDLCPYCAKVREKLQELELEYEKVDVPKPHSERATVHELSGQTAVPVLVDGDTVVADSSRIVDYLEDSYRT